MRFIHTADLRLNAAGHAALPPEKEKKRAQELTECLKNMIEGAEAEQVSGILMLGELFDRDRMFPHAKAVLFRLIREHPDLLFFCLPESEEALRAMTADDPLPPNLKLFDANWTQFRVENILVSGIVVREEELEALYESAVFPEDSINIVLLYCPDGEGGSRVEPARLKHKNIDYLAVGPSLSYHMESMDERGIAAASGSPEGLDYAEEGPHGFVVLDVDPKEKRVSGHFIPFAKRGLYTVTVDIGGAEDTEEIINRIGEAMDARRIPETALVRLILTGTLDIESGKENDRILDAFSPFCYHIELDDRTVFHVDRARYENDASLRGEFVRQVLADETLEEKERITVLRMGLQAILKEEVTA